jgi:hypothetical protein
MTKTIKKDEKMKATTDREERRIQKNQLRGMYSDYDPKMHDAFVDRFNRDLDKARIEEYQKNRGI